MTEKLTRKKYPAFAVDLVVIAVGAAVVYFVAGYVDLFELIHDSLIRHDSWQIDELFIVAVFLNFGFGVFSWRRWREVVQSSKDREQALVELQHAKERAEAANHSKGQFLANMSHEIRTPMNAIIGMTELTLDTELSDEQRENLRIVQTSSQSLLQILNDILDFSKIEAGKLELSSSSFVLRSVLGDVVKSFGPRAHEKGLEIALHVPAEVPDHLIGDPLRLRQVLVNLIGNAIKFTDAGEVVVLVEAETINSEAARFHFSVRDTGIGIPPDMQQFIFEAFTQADGSSKRRFGGTGLGLAISTRLVHLMGGNIRVESIVGSGSAFHFTTLFRLGHANSIDLQTTSSELSGLRVLIVDDNATNRRILEEAVTAWHSQSVSVDSGPAALAALAEATAAGQPFALVLLDAMMPEMDGFEVAARIQADKKIAGAMLMMLSSADSDGDSRRCLELGIAGYLRKPITPHELHESVLMALGHRLSKKPAPVAPAQDLAPPSAPLNILLAEDNPVNQRVTMGALKKRGHNIVAVNNGREALEALICVHFDLVLMDVQMPEMDGLEATRAIRQKERQTGEHVPIIAMTAHAMKGDRERCLQSGMDDYIAKPFEPKALIELITKWAPHRRLLEQSREVAELAAGYHLTPAVQDSTSVPTPISPQAVDVDVFDLESLKARVEDDLELLAEMIYLHLHSSPRLLAEVESAVDLRQKEKLVRASHTLKGVLKNMCATRCAQAVLELEIIGGSGDFESADDALLELKAEFDQLQTALWKVAEEVHV